MVIDENAITKNATVSFALIFNGDMRLKKFTGQYSLNNGNETNI